MTTSGVATSRNGWIAACPASGSPAHTSMTTSDDVPTSSAGTNGAGGSCIRNEIVVSSSGAFAALAPAPLERTEALEQLRALWHGHRIAVVLSDAEIPPGVDTAEDLEAVRKMLR